MAKVSIQNLKKQFGSSVAVSDFSLDIAEGELVAFLGPSGCGKTTTLRMIAGFIAPTAGNIFIGDTDVTHVPVHKRNTGMVFQRYALFPHMTVAENVAFGLEMHKVPKAERDTAISRVLDMVRMTELRDRYPRQLSGGQQQRVAIARALAIQPKVFLLDEPLSNLDAKLRVEVREEIRALQQRLGLTTIFVTHDQEEALAIADRMAIMHDGIVQQVGAPDALYERPANLFVADFLGKMNFFEGTPAQDNRFKTQAGSTLVLAEPAQGTHVGVRPERVTLIPGAADGAGVGAAAGVAGAAGMVGQAANRFAGTIESAAYLGSLVDVRVKLASGETILSQCVNTGEGHGRWQIGAPCQVAFDAADCVAFNR